MAVVMGVGVVVVMAPAMVMAMVAIRVMAMVAIPVMVALAMAAIQAPMVLLVMHPRWLHRHNQHHRVLASNPARNPDEPAQGCVGSSLLNELTYLHQQAIKIRIENALPDYLFNDNFLFASGFVNADDSSLREPAYAG